MRTLLLTVALTFAACVTYDPLPKPDIHVEPEADCMINHRIDDCNDAGTICGTLNNCIPCPGEQVGNFCKSPKIGSYPCIKDCELYFHN